MKDIYSVGESTNCQAQLRSLKAILFPFQGSEKDLDKYHHNRPKDMHQNGTGDLSETVL